MAKLKKILIVDDERDVLDVLAELLGDYAESVLVAQNGAEALSLLENENVDCIISDINMAPMNGIEFLNKLLQKNMKDIPFLFYTAHGTEENLMSIDCSHVRAVVSKPSFDVLEQELMKVIAC